MNGDEWLVGIGDGGPPEPFDNKGEVTVHVTTQAYSGPGWAGVSPTQTLRKNEAFVLIQANNGRTQLDLYKAQDTFTFEARIHLRTSRTVPCVRKWTIPISSSMGPYRLTNEVVFEFGAHLAGKTQTFRRVPTAPPESAIEVSNTYNGRIVFGPPTNLFQPSSNTGGMSTSGAASNRGVSGSAGAGTTSRGPPKPPPAPPSSEAGGDGFWYGGSPPGSASGSINNSLPPVSNTSLPPVSAGGFWYGGSPPSSATPSYPQYPPGHAPPQSYQSLGGFNQNSAGGYWYGGSPISASPSYPPGFGYPVAGGGGGPPGSGGGPPGSGGSSIRPPLVTSTVKAVIKEEETNILLIGAGLAGVVALVLMLQK